MRPVQKSILKLGYSLGLAVLACAAVPGSVRAATITINCPLDQIRREVITPLPADWWQTPIVNSLQSTHVVNVSGGGKALQCRYGAAGSIQRRPPDGATCTAIAGGFRCETAAAPGPQTFSTGPIELRQTYLADLDRNSASNSAADIWFEAETSDLLYLTPRNGAQLAVGNRSNRGFAGCSSAHFSGGRVSLNDIPVGSYVCARTNEGRISQFRVNALSAGSPKVLSLGYTTWK